MQRFFFFLSALVPLTILAAVPSFAQTTSVSSDGAVVIAAVAPAFPGIARAAHAKGDVIVEVGISPQGEVETAKAFSGHPLLRKVCEMAAKKWKFAAGNARPSSVRVTFSFGYVDGGKSDPEYTITFMPPYRVEVIWNPPAPSY